MSALIEEIKEEVDDSLIEESLISLFSDKTKHKLYVYVKKYRNETDAIVATDGLVAIRDLITCIFEKDFDSEKQKKMLICELMVRIKNIEKIIMKIANKNKSLTVSKRDKMLAEQISEDICRLVGLEGMKTKKLTTGIISPLLMLSESK